MYNNPWSATPSKNLIILLTVQCIFLGFLQNLATVFTAKVISGHVKIELNITHLIAYLYGTSTVSSSSYVLANVLTKTLGFVGMLTEDTLSMPKCFKRHIHHGDVCSSADVTV